MPVNKAYMSFTDGLHLYEIHKYTLTPVYNTVFKITQIKTNVVQNGKQKTFHFLSHTYTKRQFQLAATSVTASRHIHVSGR